MVAVVVAGLVLPLAGCGDESGAGGGAADPLKGKSYLSVSVTEGGKPKQLAPNTRVRLQFTDDGRLLADAGCNTMGGKVSTGGGQLTVEDGLSVTDLGCDPPRHAQDDWLVKLLQGKPTWKLEQNKLNVTTADTVLVLLDRETAEPDLVLDGTKWSVETIISGETASHSMGSEKAYLTISGERITGSTGCNDMQGIVARTDDKLTFGELGTTRRACAGDAAALEKAVLGTLKGEVSFTIDSNRLKLRAADGSGLDLTGSR